MSKTKRIGYAVATVGGGPLVSEVFPTMGEAEGFAQRLGCRGYMAVEVRS